MVKRRKVLAGLGSIAAGGAAVMGTGAFTTVNADRNFDIDVADDSKALLAIEPTGSPNSDRYVGVDAGQSDVVTTYEVELDEDIPGNAAGVNNNAITRIDDLLEVKNQGSQQVEVHVEKGYMGGTDSDVVKFFDGGHRIDQGAGVILDPGESFVLSLEVDTTYTNDIGNSELLLEYATFHAEAT